MDDRLAQHGVGRTQQHQGQGRHHPQKKIPQEQPDNSFLAVPVFSLLFGVAGSIWLTAGAQAEADAVFAMWLGITLINIVSARLVRTMRKR